ncbi:MAG: hypothetical protein H6999_10745 [Hahellaceae bacterium]|nr:hypothetical protein [Hahellaceae bacterium]
MQSVEIAKKINSELKKIGWSKNDFVREYDKFHSYKSQLTRDSLQKQLSRKTTNPALLSDYLDFLYQHSDWKKHDQVKPTFAVSDLEDDFINDMREISSNITKKLKNNLKNQ